LSISLLIPTRTREQVKNKGYALVLSDMTANKTTGHWKISEINLLKKCIEEYGCDWKRIALVLESRSWSQIVRKGKHLLDSGDVVLRKGASAFDDNDLVIAGVSSGGLSSGGLSTDEDVQSFHSFEDRYKHGNSKCKVPSASSASSVSSSKSSKARKSFLEKCPEKCPEKGLLQPTSIKKISKTQKAAEAVANGLKKSLTIKQYHAVNAGVNMYGRDYVKRR
jgi:hypothetical protein